MSHLRGEDSYMANQMERMEDELVEAACHVMADTLTYNNYRWQRLFYKVPAERLAPHYPCAERFEAMVQEELRKAA